MSKEWYEVQTYWGDDKDQGWVSERTFSTLEEAKVWADEYEIGNPRRVVQCFSVYTKGV